MSECPSEAERNPRRDRVRVLACTGYRVDPLHPLDQSADGKVQGGTRYCVVPPTGPVGKAFETRKIQVAYGLPDYQRDPAAYVKGLMEWRLNVKTVTGFRRHARVFVAIPISMYVPRGAPTFPDTDPVAIVCVDFINPLDKVDPELLKLLAEEHVEKYSMELAMLWQLRVSR
jgi:hypothetical protein